MTKTEGDDSFNHSFLLARTGDLVLGANPSSFSASVAPLTSLGKASERNSSTHPFVRRISKWKLSSVNSGFLAHQLPDFLGQLWLGKNRRIGVFRLAEASTPGDVVLVNQLKRGELPSHYILIGRDHQGEANYYLDTHQRDAAGECPIVVFRDGRPDPIGVAENFAALLINARKATA